MKAYPTTLIAAALGFALVGAAHANETPTTVPPAATAPAATPAPVAGSTSSETPVATTALPSFDSLDADRDGFIARTELPAGHALAASWAQYDADNDSRIARSDFDRYAATLKPSFMQLDTDRDGFIARTELAAGHPLARVWTEYDADNDARIARSDFDRWLLAAYPSFAELDRNADGSLTRAELPSAHALYTGFATYDSNGDAKLSRSEFDAYGSGSAAVASADEPEGEDDATEEPD